MTNNQKAGVYEMMPT